MRREAVYRETSTFSRSPMDDYALDGRARMGVRFRGATMIEHTDEGYDLFRRAIVMGDDDAWAAVHARYRPLLISWAVRYSARAPIAERYDDIADQALARAWIALTPDSFARFSSLARLLSYLRACVNTTVIDSLRGQISSECALREFHADQRGTPEQVILGNLTRDALWRVAMAVATLPAERVVLVESLIHCFPPRTIRARHPQLFPNAEAVYTIKRNLFERLQRNQDVLQLGRELLAG